MPDNPAPRRRWFQFRLSTWFVLMAILAWAMIEWPWVRLYPLSSGKNQIAYAFGEAFVQKWNLHAVIINPWLTPQAITLAAFAGWKLYANHQRTWRAPR